MLSMPHSIQLDGHFIAKLTFTYVICERPNMIRFMNKLKMKQAQASTKFINHNNRIAYLNYKDINNSR